MTSSSETTFSDLLVDTYQHAYDVHGDLDLDARRFVEELRVLIEGHLGSAASVPCRVDLLRSLHASDLYLSLSCAQCSDAAWGRFLTLRVQGGVRIQRSIAAEAYGQAGGSAQVELLERAAIQVLKVAGLK